MRLCYIVLFGVIGVLARYYIGGAVTRTFSTQFPLGTFAINITGAFLVGVIYVAGAERTAISEDLRIGIMVGLLGGFTTFSAYSLEAARLLEQSNVLTSMVYLFLSPVVGLGAAYAGLVLARTLL
jgi:CrcB protein